MAGHKSGRPENRTRPLVQTAVRNEEQTRRDHTRSYMDARFFKHFVEKYGLTVVEQNTVLPHLPGDVITVFTKSAR